MKLNKKITSLVLLSATAFGVFGLTKMNSLKAESSKLEAGKVINISNISGNLNNVNVKFEFTTSVDLDGANNALLVGLLGTDGSPITDERFVAAATNTGIYDEQGVVVSFDNVPKVIGTKTSVESNFKYTFESKDFDVVNGTKNIGSLYVLANKGADVVTDVNISEVKYSVTFGDADPVSYSYKAVIADPTAPAQFVYDFDGHQEFSGNWTGDDSSTFVSGETLATKDIVYTAQYGEKHNHTWEDVDEVSATEQATGVKAHKECDCGAKKLADGTTLVTDNDLIIPALDHTHEYEASVDWTDATEPGDKPVITYTCSASWCDETHVMDAADITVTEKAGSRVNPNCTTAGKVTYVATCTYEGVAASFEKEYSLAKVAHTPEHHVAVANSLEKEGNIEYWTCSDCKGYFLDANCTQPTTAEAVVLPKMTLEEATVISVKDLNSKGNPMIFLSDYWYEYTNNAPYKSLSLQFVWDLKDTKEADRLKITNSLNLPGKDPNWTTDNTVWFVTDQDQFFLYRNASDHDDTKNLGLTVGLHTIEYTRQAIMNGDVCTNDYVVTVVIDGVEKARVINHYDPSTLMNRLFINSGGNNNVLYDIAFADEQYQDPIYIDASDLDASGIISANTKWERFEYVADASQQSRVFRFKVKVTDFKSGAQINLNDGDEVKPCNVWLKYEDTTNTARIFFAWDKTERTKDCYFIDGIDNKVFETGETFTLEYGRLRVTNGMNVGKDLIYIKINGQYLKNDGVQSFIYTANGSGFSNNVFSYRLEGFDLYDYDYEEPVYEEAEVISLYDLNDNGVYFTDSLTLAHDDKTNPQSYSYTGTTEHNSVVLKFQYELKTPSSLDCQIIFNNGWYPKVNEKEHGGCVWLRNDSLFISKDGGNYVVKDNPLDVVGTYDIEVGKKYILSGTGEGKYYIYILVNGQLASSYVTGDPMPEETGVKFTGKNGDVIKNVVINKTVTLKVGEKTQNVSVQRSSLVTIPTFGTDVVPSDKRITSWKVEGTDVAFNPLSDRVFDDMVLVAVLDDFKWKVTFGTTETYVLNGADIAAPETNPTQASDATNHYVFEGWYNGETKFVAGTKATADITYTAKFTAVAHTFGEWVIDTEASCDTAGSKHRTCECGYEEVASIPAAHKLVHHEANPATCAADGTIEYWECTECHKKFSDDNCENEITSIVDPKHGLEHHEAVAHSCTKDGNIEYWYCEKCNKYYTDAQGLHEVDSIKDPKAHDLVHIAAKAATCEEAGNIEYWHCSECGKNYSDAAGTQLVSNVSIPATDHHYGANGICDKCGEKDPYYVEPAPAKKGCKGATIPSMIGLITLAGTLLVSKKRKNLD